MVSEVTLRDTPGAVEVGVRPSRRTLRLELGGPDDAGFE